MKPYILVQIQKDLTVRSTYCEVEAPEYMYSKWENLMLENPQFLEITLKKGPVLHTGIQTEDEYAIWTKFEDSPINEPLMDLVDYEHLGVWKKAVIASGFIGKIFLFSENEAMLLLKLSGDLAKTNN